MQEQSSFKFLHRKAYFRCSLGKNAAEEAVAACLSATGSALLSTKEKISWALPASSELGPELRGIWEHPHPHTAGPRPAPHIITSTYEVGSKYPNPSSSPVSVLPSNTPKPSRGEGRGYARSLHRTSPWMCLTPSQSSPGFPYQSWYLTRAGPGHWLSKPHFWEDAAHKQIISHFQEKHKISPHKRQPISPCIFPGSWRKRFLHSTPQREGSVQAQFWGTTQGWQTRHRAFRSPPSTLPERKLRFKPDVQVTDCRPLAVTRSTSEQLLC